MYSCIPKIIFLKLWWYTHAHITKFIRVAGVDKHIRGQSTYLKFPTLNTLRFSLLQGFNLNSIHFKENSRWPAQNIAGGFSDGRWSLSLPGPDRDSTWRVFLLLAIQSLPTSVYGQYEWVISFKSRNSGQIIVLRIYPCFPATPLIITNSLINDSPLEIIPIHLKSHQ